MRGEWDVDVGSKLDQRQKELGLSDEQLAAKANVSDMTLIWEIVGGDNSEIESVYPVRDQKKVYAALGLNMLDLFEIPCVYCAGEEGPWAALAGRPRNEIIKCRREQLGLSLDDLLQRWGYKSWYEKYKHTDWAAGIMEEAEHIENTPDAVDDLGFMDVVNLAEVLALPLQLLLGEKCSRCGR